MDLVLCHTTADFDTLGAAVGVTCQQPGTRLVLAGGCHPSVQSFLALHRDEYSLIERRSVRPEQIRSLTIVDTQYRDRLGPVADWITRAEDKKLPITLYDHHGQGGDIPATTTYVDAVGAATTLVVEQLQAQSMALTVAEATVMALGIHVDTGSLTFEQSTQRDALALAWLMGQGANQRAIAEFVEPELSPTLQTLLSQAMDTVQSETLHGHTLSWVQLPLEGHVPGLSSLAERLISLTDSDSLLLGAHYPAREGYKVVLIGRARGRTAVTTDNGGIDFGALFRPLGGGGHATAAAASLQSEQVDSLMAELLGQLRQQIPKPPVARELMSSPVRTIRPQTTIAEAQRILLRYGHSGLSVVNNDDELVGIISRRDLDLALHHGFSHAPVKGYMTTNLKTIGPNTSLPEIEALMVTYDIGRLPVLEQRQLLGVVTRTDVLRQLHQGHADEYGGKLLPDRSEPLPSPPSAPALKERLHHCLGQPLWHILQQMAHQAERQGWHLYLVGGAVRDVLLADSSAELALTDIDLVVDGFYQAAQVGAGVSLAQGIKHSHPEVDLQVYGRFQTAALVWHRDGDSSLASLMIDIATARTEFYPYPAANPEVEASSIRQDLYRRDFTINAMAIRLTQPGAGLLLDFFGGWVDLHHRCVRVLHANSFIEDPTRIYRAVRFAVRLAFQIDPQTEGFIHHALDSGIYTQMQQQVAKVPALQTRLKNELKYILEAAYWQPALGLLDKLGALKCLHSQLAMSERLWHQLRRVSRWIQRFDFEHHLVPWQMRLEVLLAELPKSERSRVAKNLQLPQPTIDRLAHLDHLESDWRQTLPACQTPSQIVQQLRRHDLATLLLVSARHPRPLGQIIWRYLTHWAEVRPPLNGHDLKQLGYRPGPRYRQILAALLAATLDGHIQSRCQARQFLAEHFPLPVSDHEETTKGRE
ncbi:CBS domain-containing protein [Halomicronema hongdechloris]